MEHTEITNIPDTDNIAVTDDNGNFEEKSRCSDIAPIEDKETPITEPADIKYNAAEGSDTLIVEKVEMPLLHIKNALETSSEVVNKDVILEVSNLDTKAKDSIIGEESSVMSINIKNVNPEAEAESVGESLEANLESVVAEDPKVQSQVLKCIIGSKASYIPKTVESFVDANVESKGGKVEKKCELMNTEAIHIEMKIKDKIEEITIENDEKVEDGDINSEITVNKISEENPSDFEALNAEKITTESKQNKKDTNDTIDCTAEKENDSSPRNYQKLEGVEVTTKKNETVQAVFSKVNIVDEQFTMAVEENLDLNGCSKEDKETAIEESDIKVTKDENDFEETQAAVYSAAESKNSFTRVKEDIEYVHISEQEDLQEKDEAREDVSKTFCEISVGEGEPCVQMKTTESYMSQTPDLVKVCEPANPSAKEQIQEVTDELQRIDDSIKGAERECEGQEVKILTKENVGMEKATEKTSFEALDIQTNGSISNNIINDLISESGEKIEDTKNEKIIKKNTASMKQKAKVNVTGTKNIKSSTTTKIDKTKGGKPKVVKTTAKKERSKSTIIAGQQIELNSDKAQYLHLTLEQIQQLAMKQKSGELFAPEEPSEDAVDTHCAVHAAKSQKTNQGRIKATVKNKSPKTQKNDLSKEDESDNTNTAAVKESPQSPDVIKEAEATTAVSRLNVNESMQEESIKNIVPTQKIVRAKSPLKKNLVSENKVSSRSVSVGRQNKDKTKDTSNESKIQNTKVREITMKKQDMLFKSHSSNEGDNIVPNKKMSKIEPRTPSIIRDGTSKGGLLAPTQSWLLHIGDKTDVKSRSPSPGPKLNKRSVSAPRKISDRSPSPKGRIQDPSKDSRRNEKNAKESPKPQASPRTPRQTSTIRASPEPNTRVKRTGSFKKAPITGNQNLNSKLSTNKISANGNEQNPVKESNAGKTETPSKQKSNKSEKAAADKEENIMRTEISDHSLISLNTSTNITKKEANQNGMNTMTKCDEQSTLFQSNSKSESTKGSGIEETSVTATEVIEMFESDKKAASETTEASQKYDDKNLNDTKGKTNGVNKEDETINKAKKVHAMAKTKNETMNESLEKSANKRITSKTTNISSNKVTKTNGSSNAHVSSIKNKSVKKTTGDREASKKPSNTSISNKTMKSCEHSEDSKIEKKTGESEISVIKERSSSSTFTKESNLNVANGTSNTKVEAKTRTTMIIRLQPGSSKRISAYLEHQPRDPSSDSLNLTEDVKYEDTPGAICGLEISFSSVPQDVDIKLISADEPLEGSS